MNQTSLYDLNDSVWTVDTETNIAENWLVKSIDIVVTEAAVAVSYILHNKVWSRNFLETDIYASLSDALDSLPLD